MYVPTEIKCSNCGATNMYADTSTCMWPPERNTVTRRCACCGHEKVIKEPEPKMDTNEPITNAKYEITF